MTVQHSEAAISWFVWIGTVPIDIWNNYLSKNRILNKSRIRINEIKVILNKFSAPDETIARWASRCCLLCVEWFRPNSRKLKRQNVSNQYFSLCRNSIFEIICVLSRLRARTRRSMQKEIASIFIEEYVRRLVLGSLRSFGVPARTSDSAWWQIQCAQRCLKVYTTDRAWIFKKYIIFSGTSKKPKSC